MTILTSKRAGRYEIVARLMDPFTENVKHEVDGLNWVSWRKHVVRLTCEKLGPVCEAHSSNGVFTCTTKDFPLKIVKSP